MARKMIHGNGLWARVIDALRRGLLPQQTSGILQRMPDAVHISHQTIYTVLYAMPRGELCAPDIDAAAVWPQNTQAPQCGH
jgi:IS30 family transposase